MSVQFLLETLTSRPKTPAVPDTYIRTWYSVLPHVAHHASYTSLPPIIIIIVIAPSLGPSPLPPSFPHNNILSSLPLLMLRILTTNDIHIAALLPPHTLTPIAQLLHRTPHLHTAQLLAHRQRRYAEALEPRAEIVNAGALWVWPVEEGKRRAQAAAGWGVHVAHMGAEGGAGEHRAAERKEEGAGKHFGGGFLGAGCRGWLWGWGLWLWLWL